MKRTLLLTTLLLAACAPAPAVAPAARPAAVAVTPAAAPVSAVARVALSNPAGRRLLADPVGWQASDVARVTLTVTRDGVAVLAPIVLEGAAIAAPVTLSPLSRGVTYAVVGRAYRRIGDGDAATYAAIDAHDVDAATCTTTFTTGTTSLTELAQPLRIQFGSQSYAGTGDTQLDIDDGAVTDEAATPEITVSAPSTP
jgi:hypothetical protein